MNVWTLIIVGLFLVTFCDAGWFFGRGKRYRKRTGIYGRKKDWNRGTRSVHTELEGEPTFRLWAYCGSHMKLFVDGHRVKSDTNSVDEVPVFDISMDAKVIGVECSYEDDNPGLVAQSNVGHMTDDTWTCSNQLEEDWHTVHFQPKTSAWAPATRIKRALDDDILNALHGFPQYSDAWKIYTPHYDVPNHDNQVYCKKLL